MPLLTEAQYNRVVDRLFRDETFRDRARRDVFAAFEEEGIDVKSQLPPEFIEKVTALSNRTALAQGNPCAVCGICAICTACGELNAASGLIGVDIVLGIL